MIAATLVHDTENLARSMRQQIADIQVVDNGSDPPITGSVIRLPVNRYFTGGWNAYMSSLAEYSDMTYVWMLNSDIEQASEAMGIELERLAYQYQAAVITPAFNSPHPDFHQNGVVIKQVPWIDWCCPLVSLEAWRKVGGFDEVFTGYGADIDWCFRARGLGFKFFVSSMHFVHHLGGASPHHEMIADMDYAGRKLEEKYSKNWGDLVRF